MVLTTGLLGCGSNPNQDEPSSPFSESSGGGVSDSDEGAGASSGPDSGSDGGQDDSTGTSGDDGGTETSGGPTPEPAVSCDPNRFVSVDAPGGGDGSSGAPWTLTEAMGAAGAGDVVEVGPGVYTAPATGERHRPAWSPTNSGVQGEPIVFCARHAAVHGPPQSQRSELRNDATDPNGGSPTFGSLDRSHIIWDGLYVNEAVSPSRADTGPVTVWGSEDITISRCVIEGATIEREDNHNGVRLEAVTRVRLVDNHIFGVRSVGNPNRNHACITTYDASDITIENNEINDCALGIYLKGDHVDDGLPNGAFFVHRNYIHDVSLRAVEVLGVTLVGETPSDISHNLLVNNGTGVGFNNVADDHPAAVHVHHNTMVGSARGLSPFPSTMLDVTLSDNLVSGGPVIYTGWDASTVELVIANGFDTNYNFGDPQTDWVESEAGYAYDLAAWQASSSLDGQSLVGDPMFVGRGDYHLGPDSPALTASSSGEAVGCYVTGEEVIGVRPPQG